jgi:hypothetical protein
MGDDCPELKNIKYKSMLLSGPPNPETKENMSSLADLMEKEKEKQQNTRLPWSKLDASTKLSKLYAFAEYFAKNSGLGGAELKSLKKTLKDGLDRKLLTKTGAVVYDRNKEIISNVLNLTHNRQTKTFVLKDPSKRATTSKSLAPKKPHKTRKVDPKGAESKAAKSPKKEKIDII